MNYMAVFNTLIIIVIVIAGLLTVVMDNILNCTIALTVAAIFISIEFLILRAPGAAIFQIMVGAIFVPSIFIITLKKINDKVTPQKKKGEK